MRREKAQREAARKAAMKEAERFFAENMGGARGMTYTNTATSQPPVTIESILKLWGEIKSLGPLPTRLYVHDELQINHAQHTIRESSAREMFWGIPFEINTKIPDDCFGLRLSDGTVRLFRLDGKPHNAGAVKATADFLRGQPKRIAQVNEL